MKRLLYMPVVLLLFLSVSLAQDVLETKKRIEIGMLSLMSKMLHGLIAKADNLDLTEKQREELALIEEKYVFPLVRKEAENLIASMELVNIIQKPNFDPAKAKKAIKTLHESTLERDYLLINGLVELRNVIGLENYTKITSRVVFK